MQKTTLLFLVIASLLAVLSAYQQFRLHGLRQSIDELQSENADQRTRIQADEAFLAGDTATAFQLYASLSDSLAEARRELWAVFEANNRLVTPPKPQPAPTNTPARDRTVAQLEEIIDSLSRVISQNEEQKTGQLPTTPPQPVAMDFRTKEFLQFPTGKRGETVNYLGEIRDGKAHGKGVAVWKNGSTYQGQWQDNLRHGQGAFTWTDGEQYAGAYKNDLRHGWGVYITKVGERYEGGWEDDKREGPGRLYDRNGKLKLEGVWKGDKLVQTVKAY